MFLDESGLDTRMVRSHARAPRGQRAIGRVPVGHWSRPAILGAIARDGMVAAMTVAAATSTPVFVAFIEEVLAPAPRARPEAMLVMDNLAPHKAAAAREALDRARLARRYLPPYSPDPSRQCLEADRTGLVQAQGGTATDRREIHRRPRRRHACRARQDHPRRRARMVSPLWVPFSLNCQTL